MGWGARLWLGGMALALGACLSAPSPHNQGGDGGGGDDAGGADAAASDGATDDAGGPDATPTVNTHSARFTAASDHYLSAADQPGGVDITSTITIEAWIQLASLPAVGQRYAIAVKANVAVPDNSYALELKNEAGVYRIEARVEGMNGGTNGWDSAGWDWGSIDVDTWYHLAFTYDIAGDDVVAKFHHYRDGSEILGGVLLYDTDIDTVRNSGAPLVIGARVTGTSSQNQFDGRIDEVRVWDHVRSGTEIAADRARELTGSETGLLGYWQLDGDLEDASGGGNTLSATGATAPAFDTDTPF